jgi:hypothetical protein
MKLTKNKIIVSALALAVGASLVGSVSSTIAWYQYSTRANVSFIGESSGFSGNLQMRFVSEADDDTAWRTKITWQEMEAELLATDYAQKIVPMTFGRMSKDDACPATGYIQPLPGVSDMTKWVKATSKNYAQFQLQLRYNERDGVEEGDPATDEKNVEKDVYLTKLLIQEDANNGTKGDLSDAVRVHISSSYGQQSKNKLISNQGKEIAVKGALDIDGDGDDDQAYPDADEFGFTHDDNDLVDIIYGDDGNDETREIQTSYKATATDAVGGVHFTQDEIDNAQQGDAAYQKTTDDWKVEPVYPALAYSENNKLYNESDKASTPDSSKAIGKTVASNNSYLTVKVTIWVEGWQELEGSAIWDFKYINSKFNVGIQFAVQDVFAQE